jgi:hypothetical protein
MQTLPVHMAPAAAFEAIAPRRLVLLVGSGASGISTCIVARRACARLPVRLVCGDNRFNPYLISRSAKLQGVRPAEALGSILVARAFTAFQLVELIQGLEPAANDFITITGICSAFFDEDLSHNDAARLFYRAYWKLRSLAQSGVALLLVDSGALPVERRGYFLKELCQTSDVVLSLSNAVTFTLEQKAQRGAGRPPAEKRLRGN